MRVSMAPACAPVPPQCRPAASQNLVVCGGSVNAADYTVRRIRARRNPPPGRRGGRRTGRKVTIAMNQTAAASVPAGTGTTRRWVTDGVIAAVVTALQVAGTYGAAYHLGTSPSPLEYAVTAVSGLVLIARRRYPVLVLAITGA